MRLFIAAVALLSTAVCAPAHDYKKGTLTIDHPWARPTAGKVGAAYFAVTNAGADDALIGVKTDMSNAAELHAHIHNAEIMRMRKVETVKTPAGATVKFEPGGLHIMLIGLKQPLIEGSSFPLTLVFEKAGEIPVDVKVETKSAHGAEAHSAGHKHH
ncbi:MAG: copper chaperone PCu(A)C [Hyphomicrobiales bacterium]|nr:copper chaperone PCu(A)C [Hyphomicrobiales bacterium]